MGLFVGGPRLKSQVSFASNINRASPQARFKIGRWLGGAPAHKGGTPCTRRAVCVRVRVAGQCMHTVRVRCMLACMHARGGQRTPRPEDGVSQAWGGHGGAAAHKDRHIEERPPGAGVSPHHARTCMHAASAQAPERPLHALQLGVGDLVQHVVQHRDLVLHGLHGRKRGRVGVVRGGGAGRRGMHCSRVSPCRAARCGPPAGRLGPDQQAGPGPAQGGPPRH
jgi:hypothetical protein